MKALFLLALGGAAGAAEIDRPAGGWTHSGLIETDRRVEYAYPNNLIDRGGQRGRTIIEGRLKSIDKASRKPPTLVVNGNAMPLQHDEQRECCGHEKRERLSQQPPLTQSTRNHHDDPDHRQCLGRCASA